MKFFISIIFLYGIMMFPRTTKAAEDEIESLRLLMWETKAKYVLTLGAFETAHNLVKDLKKRADSSFYGALEFDLIKKNLEICYRSALKIEKEPKEEKINFQRAAEKFTVGKGLPDHPDVKAFLSNLFHKYEGCDREMVMNTVSAGIPESAVTFIFHKFDIVQLLRVLIDIELKNLLNETTGYINSAPASVAQLLELFNKKSRTKEEREKFTVIENEIKTAILKIKTDINPLFAQINEISEKTLLEISRIDFIEAQ